MAKKSYSPLASYTDLKEVEGELNQAKTVDKIRELVVKHGPRVGYRAFCYLLGGKMTPEAMKPDEACVAAATLEQQGKADEAMEIYKKVIKVHSDHPIAKSKVAGNQ
ncbi:MAG: hypothetical protein JXM69_08265 [Anaerolineae bacterium]|nr:hypothetical protein [Anaerolineae bacterium]